MVTSSALRTLMSHGPAVALSWVTVTLAHFPLDVVAGMAFGYPIGLFAWELVCRFGLTGPRRERTSTAEVYA